MQIQLHQKPVLSIRLPAKTLNRMEGLIDKYHFRGRADFVEKAIEYYAEEVKASFAAVRQVPMGQLKKEVLSYMEGRDRAYPDEIAEALGVDIFEVLKALRKLEKERKMREYQ